MSIAAASAASPIGMTAIGRGGWGCCVHQHGETLDPGGPADGGGWRAAHFSDQSVVASAGHDGALGAEFRGDELERGVAVIIQAADDAGVLRRTGRGSGPGAAEACA